MPEKIAMTPPDQNGNQVYWEKIETDNGILFVPENVDLHVLDLLVPESYAKNTAEDGICLGIGSIDSYTEAGVVHRAGDFAVKSAPFFSQDRLVDWLRANLTFRQALINLPKIDQDHIIRKVNGVYHKITTPKYFGALALEADTGKSVVIMSDETNGSNNIPEVDFSIYLDARLMGITMRAFERVYPDGWVRWDHHSENWIYRPEDRTYVRLDIFGTKKEESYNRYC